MTRFSFFFNNQFDILRWKVGVINVMNHFFIIELINSDWYVSHKSRRSTNTFCWWVEVYSYISDVSLRYFVNRCQNSKALPRSMSSKKCKVWEIFWNVRRIENLIVKHSIQICFVGLRTKYAFFNNSSPFRKL